MATQLQTVTSVAQDKVQSYTTGALSTLDTLTTQITGWGQGILDRFIPPEQRAALVAKVQEFMLANPKLSVRTLDQREP